MIRLVDIKTAINNALAPVGLKTYGNEVKEGFLRPCFFIGVTPVASDTFKAYTSENTLMLEIIYFSTDKTDLENLKMYDTLKEILTPTLAIGTRKVMARNFRAEVVDETDRIYSVKFDLNYYDEIIDITPAPDEMQTLILKLGGQ